MRKIFLMQPRYSGKTTKATYEFLKDPNNTLFISHSYGSMKRIHNIVGGDTKNFASPNNIIHKAIGWRPKNIILDEYMLFENRCKIYEIIQQLQPENLYIFSTSDKIYNKKLFDFIKTHKRMLPYGELLLRCGGTLITKEFIKEFNELYYNFLTDDDTILIDSDFGCILKDRSDLIGLLGKEQYAVEILNIYLN